MDSPSAAAAYHAAKDKTPDLFCDLDQRILAYCEHRETPSSKEAGAAVLSAWSKIDDWKKLFPSFDFSRMAFGLAMRDCLKANGWEMADHPDPDRQDKVYFRTRAT